MTIESPELLNAWLARELTPICDAEPSALAKYVVALLRKPDKKQDELKDFCLSQLEVFLQHKTASFVEKLFTVLNSKAYLNQSGGGDAKRQDDAKPETVASSSSPATASSRNKSPQRDERSRHPAADNSNLSVSARPSSRRVSPPAVATSANVVPTGRRRISPPPPDPNERRSRPVSGGGGGGGGGGGASGSNRIVVAGGGGGGPGRGRSRRSRSRSPGSGGVASSAGGGPRHRRRDGSTDMERRRTARRCRDYEERGFCTRGDSCPYDHGPDPVVVEDGALPKIMSGGPAPYNYLYSVNPPPPGVEYNPEAPGFMAAPETAPPAPWRPGAPIYGGGGPAEYAPAGPAPQQTVIGYDPLMPSVMVQQQQQISAVGGPMYAGRGGGGFRGRGRGGGGPYRGRRGHLHGGLERGSAHGNTNKALIVRRIPPELNTIVKLNDHFSRFGDIKNIEVNYEGTDSALVTFSTRLEAQTALHSTDPIFNNRFIKVMWHTPPEEIAAAAAAAANSENKAGPDVPVSGGPVAGVLRSRLPPAVSQQLAPQAPPTVLPRPHETRYVSASSAAERGRLLELRRKKKSERANQVKLTDVLRRKHELLTKNTESQRTMLAKVKQLAPDATDERAKWMAMLKSTQERGALLKGEIAELSEKLTQSKLSEEAAAKEVAAAVNPDDEAENEQKRAKSGEASGDEEDEAENNGEDEDEAEDEQDDTGISSSDTASKSGGDRSEEEEEYNEDEQEREEGGQKEEEEEREKTDEEEEE